MTTIVRRDSDKNTIASIACRIDRVRISAIKNVLAMGEALSEAHPLLSSHSRNGAWGKFITKRCGFSRTSAHRYMRAFENFGSCSKLEQQKIDDSAIFLLSAASCPPKAKDAALELAEKGGKVTHAVARQIIKKVKSKSESENSARPFDCNTASDRLRDWLRRELNRWPDEHREEALQLIRQFIDKLLVEGSSKSHGRTARQREHDTNEAKRGLEQAGI